ncbi:MULTISPECIES: flagellar biosynthesis anti-sigma factor FlgM [Corallincola]|uniref:Negative regulator of flagellin synthesis n=3 Tax=Corallincola TaxID=1775176 RepID=A0A368N4W7_9GAMM|nr:MULTISPECIES: flagellar biosynthesis anti-sigma factor FlgM [Corallincola]RCU44601.1 flagellar biosynthesis anti-sigma factor FlgM [Corallincola holothuriorum]TAA40346.1 flagellar biosynthesis anti-sigma factor FlgM [Corallincola spongiicola]TCI05347.1 flagellar biosynthesis anti-sigma factor FlgM [Corallincola luteus]
MAVDLNKIVPGRPQDVVANKQARQQNVQQQATTQAKAPEQSAKQAQDSVSITPQAQQLAQTQKAMAKAPSVSQEKVAELRKAISEGNYKVDPDKLAKAMTKLESELFGIN